MSPPSKKADQNEVHSVKDLLQFSISSAYSWVKKAPKKCGHLIAQVHNTEVKCPIARDTLLVTDAESGVNIEF